MASVYDLWIKRGPGGKPVRSARWGTRPETRFQVRFTDPGDGRQKIESFAVRDEAELRCAELAVQLRRGLYRPPTAETVEGLWEQYVASRTWTASSHAQQASRWRKHLAPVIARVPVSKVSRQHVREIERRLDIGGVLPNTRRGVLSALATLFEYAVDEGLMPANPARGSVGRVRGKRVVDRIMTSADVRTLHTTLAETDPTGFAAEIYRTALGSGLRANEIRSLTIDRIFVDQRPVVIRVDRQLVKDSPMAWGDPKGKIARDVPITDDLAAMLSARISHRTAGFVWPSSRDARRPINMRTLGERVAAGVEKAGVDVPGGRPLHAGRHYFASGLLHAGVPITQVSKILGHATPAQTLSTYAHVLDDGDPAKIVAAWDGLDPLKSA